MLQVRQRKSELGNPVLVALALGKIGIEHAFLAVAAHAKNFVIGGDTRRHALSNFAAKHGETMAKIVAMKAHDNK